MALTQSFLPDRYLSNPAIGYIQVKRFGVASDVSLAGQTVYVDVFRYVTDVALPPLDGVVPQFGYSASYPAAGMVVEMFPLVGTPNSQRFLRIDLVAVTDFTFEVQVFHSVTSDFNDFITNDVRNNVHRYYRSIQPGTSDFDNTSTVNFFNTTSRLVAEVSVTDGVSPPEQVYLSEDNTSGRFWERGDFNSAGERFNFQWRLLTANGSDVNGFSAYEPLRFQFTVEDPTGTFNSFHIGIIRVDDSANSLPYADDLELNYATALMTGFFTGLTPPNLSLTGLVPQDAFTGLIPIEQLGASDTYQASVTLNPDYFTSGGTYRMFVVTENLAPDLITRSVQVSFITENIQANLCPPITVGNITARICDYNFGSEVHVNACVINAAACERLKVCVNVDKADYNQQVDEIGTSGNWDNNLIEARVCIAASPHIVAGVPQCEQQVTDVVVSVDDETNYEVCYTFRIPDTWAGNTNYIWFLFRMGMVDPQGVPYEDMIWYPVRIDVREFDDEGLDIIGLTVSEDGVDISTDNYYCDDTDGTGLLIVNATLDVADPENYVAIPLIRENNPALEWQEENIFPNSNLESLDSPLISFTGSRFDGGDVSFIIPKENLQVGREYCAKIIAKRDPANDVNVCDCITLSLVQQLSGLGDDVTLSYEIGDTGGETITSVVINAWDLNSPNAGLVVGSGTFTSSVGNITFDVQPPGDSPLQIRYNIVITTATGCVFMYEATLQSPVTDQPYPVFSILCVDACDIIAKIAADSVFCLYTIGLGNVQTSINPGDIFVTAMWDETVSSSCAASKVESLSNNYGVVEFGLSADTPFQNGGFIFSFQVNAHDGVSVVGFVDIVLNSLPFVGTLESEFLDWVQNMIMPSIETQISAWTQANFGFMAQNGLDYILTPVVDGFTVRFDFTARHNIGAGGFWIGTDPGGVTGNYFPDGATITPFNAVNSNIETIVIFGDEDVGCSMLHAASEVGTPAVPVVDIGNSTSFKIILNPPVVTLIPDVTGIPETGTATNYSAECFEFIDLNASLLDPSGFCAAPIYSWEYSGDPGFSANTASIQVSPDMSGDYTLTVMCGLCTVTSTVTIPD